MLWRLKLREQLLLAAMNTTDVRKVDVADLIDMMDRIVWRVAGKLEEDLGEIARRYAESVTRAVKLHVESGDIRDGDVDKLAIAAEMFVDAVYEDFERAVSQRIYWDFIEYEVDREDEYEVLEDKVRGRGHIAIGIAVKTRADLPTYFLVYSIEFAVGFGGVELYKVYLREAGKS